MTTVTFQTCISVDYAIASSGRQEIVYKVMYNTLGGRI